jgi:hypothetical protein
MIDYFDGRIEAEKTWRADVQTQAEEMRTSGKNIKDFASKTSKEIEIEIQDFIKHATAIQDKHGNTPSDENFKVGFTGGGVTAKRVNLDIVNADMNHEVEGMDAVTTEYLENWKDLHDDYDKTSDTYPIMANLAAGIRGNWTEGGSMKMKFDPTKNDGNGGFNTVFTIPNPAYTAKYAGGKPNSMWSQDWQNSINPNTGEPNPEFLEYSSEQVQALVAENDAVNRTGHEDNLKVTIDGLENKVKTYQSRFKNEQEAILSGKKSHGGKFIDIKTYMDEAAELVIRQDSAANENDPNAPDMVDGIWDNNCRFNDNIMLSILKGGEVNSSFGGKETLKGEKGGIDLFNLVNSIPDREILGDPAEGVLGNTKTQATEMLAQILDSQTNDFSGRAQMLGYLYDISGQTGGKTKEQFIKDSETTLQLVRKKAAKRYLVNEMVSRGLASDHIEAKIKDEDDDSSSSSSGGDDDGPDAYAINQANQLQTTMNTADNLISDFGGLTDTSLIDVDGDDDSSYDVGDFSENANMGNYIDTEEYKDLKEDMSGRTFKYGGTSVPVKDFHISQDGTMTFEFQKGSATEDKKDAKGRPTGEKTKVDFEMDSDTFNIYKPEDMRNFYKAMSPEAGTSSKYTREFTSAYYDKNMVNNFFSGEPSADFEKLKSPRYQAEWFDWINKKPGGKNKIIETLVAQHDLSSYVDKGGANYNEKIAEFYFSNSSDINDWLINNPQ